MYSYLLNLSPGTRARRDTEAHGPNPNHYLSLAHWLQLLSATTEEMNCCNRSCLESAKPTILTVWFFILNGLSLTCNSTEHSGRDQLGKGKRENNVSIKVEIWERAQC